MFLARRIVALLPVSAVVLTATVACSDSVSPGSSPGVPHIRIINEIFQGDDPAAALARPIDYLIDSATTGAGVANLSPLSMTAGDSGNGYRNTTPGVHSFAARVAGAAPGTTGETSFYTTSTNLPFLPKLVLNAGEYYTILVAGIIPSSGNIPQGTVPMTIITDDQFPGPIFNNVLKGRFHIINLAPYADPSGSGTYVDVYVTNGSTPPADVTVYVPQAQYTSYQSTSAYINVDPGTYVVTFRTSFTGIDLAQQTITVSAGDVRTLVLQSTSAAAPSASNHRVVSLLDHHYD